MQIKSSVDWSVSQDQAVLAEVIRQSADVGHKLGRTALQKIPYFLKRQGVPLDYVFDLHHFGPFCQDILWDAEKLLLMNVIGDEGGFNGGSSYVLGENGKPEIDGHREFLNKFSDQIASVIKLLAPLTTKQLEVVATIDYFFRYVSAGEKGEPFKAEVIRRFLEAKPQYKPETSFVERMYDRMAEIGMIKE